MEPLVSDQVLRGGRERKRLWFGYPGRGDEDDPEPRSMTGNNFAIRPSICKWLASVTSVRNEKVG